MEPYAGGAGVALSLLYEEYASHIHINDIDQSVYAFWDAVLNAPDELCDRIVTTPVTMEEWERQKEVQHSEDSDPMDLAFSTFFLNRTNRSGIVDGGVIGGKKQDGPWKLDARYNSQELIQRIRKASRYRNRITLTRIDAAEYLREEIGQLPERTFIYFDPPYYVSGGGLYQNSYHDDEHEEIAKLVRKVKRPWIVSYDAVPNIVGLYKDFTRITYDLSYSAADHYRGSEVMFFSDELTLPPAESPANIRVDVVDKIRQAGVSLF